MDQMKIKKQIRNGNQLSSRGLEEHPSTGASHGGGRKSSTAFKGEELLPNKTKKNMTYVAWGDEKSIVLSE